jgi:dolichol-phosphate mannosyltransferase
VPVELSAVELSVVVPMHDEAQNVVRLAREIAAALVGRRFELLLVDDGSADGTLTEALGLAASIPELRVLHHARRLGQSAALWSGVRAARAPWIVSLDGDCQNDPHDIPRLLAARAAERDESVRLVMGHRTERHDTAWRRFQSRIANAVRGRLLGDRTPDTGCGIKLFARDAFLALPRFDHMHRFLPALFLREGARVISVPVRHRARIAGRSKYGMLERLAAGLVDLGGVLWLGRRAWPARAARELTGAPERASAVELAAGEAIATGGATAAAREAGGVAPRPIARGGIALGIAVTACIGLAVLAGSMVPTRAAAQGKAPAAQCRARLAVSLSPEVPNPRDPAFLSSLAGEPGFRLVWLGHSDMSQTLELIGPGPAYRCTREIERMRSDARVLDIRVVH